MPENYQSRFLKFFKKGLLEANIREDTSYYWLNRDFAESWNFLHAAYLASVQERQKKANDFFHKLSLKPDYVSVIPHSVYVKSQIDLKSDESRIGYDYGLIKARYTILSSEGEILADTRSFISPATIHLDQVLPALALALIGTQTGETREIFIHPSYAYGLRTRDDSGHYLKAIISVFEISPYTFSLDVHSLDSDETMSKLFDGYSDNKLKALGKKLAYNLGLMTWGFYQDCDESCHILEVLKHVDLAIKSEHRILSENQDQLANLMYAAFRKKSRSEKEYAERLFAQDETLTCLVPNRLYYKEIKGGTGDLIKRGDEVEIVYQLRNRFGQVFDQSPLYPQPSSLDLKRAKRGFREGLVGLKRGAKGILYIHPDWSGQDYYSPPYFRPFVAAEVEL